MNCASMTVSESMMVWQKVIGRYWLQDAGSDATPVLSISNQISLEFKTDGSGTGTGFQIYYFVGDQGKTGIFCLR